MSKMDLLQGTLDMLALRVLNAGPMHGWGIAARIQLVTNDVLQLQEGTIYPALYRMEQKGWIKSEWGQSENNRRAKFYSLTKDGRKQLATEANDWNRLVSAISAVMESA